jgi:hypothetical protein
MTRAPFRFCEATYRAIPPTARCTLAKVNSSAITARHPDVPNLICVSMFDLSYEMLISLQQDAESQWLTADG